MMKSKHLSSNTFNGKPPSTRIGKTLLSLATWKEELGEIRSAEDYNKVRDLVHNIYAFSSKRQWYPHQQQLWQNDKENVLKKKKSKHEGINSCCGKMTKKMFKMWRFLMTASSFPLGKNIYSGTRIYEWQTQSLLRKDQFCSRTRIYGRIRNSPQWKQQRNNSIDDRGG